MVTWDILGAGIMPTLLLHIPPAETDNSLATLGIFSHSYWVLHKFQAVTSLHLGHSSESCLPQAILREEETSPTRQRAVSLPLSIKVENPRGQCSSPVTLATDYPTHPGPPAMPVWDWSSSGEPEPTIRVLWGLLLPE